MLAGISQISAFMTLRNRFSEDVVFIDDPSIPAETVLADGDIFMVLTDTGISFHSPEILDWDNIKNDRVATISFKGRDPGTGVERGGGTKEAFRFEYKDERFDIPFAALKIEPWKLDLLLYIYRGRHAAKQRTELSQIPAANQ